MPIDVGKYAYSTYEGYDEYPYRCISYLIENNEIIWRLLKYNSPDAWDISKYPNLTHAEKAELIYTGVGEMIDFNVFSDVGQPDSFTKQTTILRISNYTLVPDNRTTGTATMIFEVYSHYHLNQLTNRRTRGDMILQQLIKTFNGKDVGTGLGKLFFDKAAVPSNTIQASGQLPFRGKWMLMSNRAGG